MEQFLSISTRFPKVQVKYMKSGQTFQMNSKDLLPNISFISYKQLDGWDEHEWEGEINSMRFRLYLKEEADNDGNYFFIDIFDLIKLY